MLVLPPPLSRLSFHTVNSIVGIRDSESFLRLMRFTKTHGLSVSQKGRMSDANAYGCGFQIEAKRASRIMPIRRISFTLVEFGFDLIGEEAIVIDFDFVNITIE